MLHLSFSENKGLWFDVRWSNKSRYIFNFDVSWSKKTDHAGFVLWIALGKLWIELEITDKRHWNYEKDQWYEYGEDMTDEQR